MPRIIFTSHLGGIAPPGEPEFAGETVGEALTACCGAHPADPQTAWFVPAVKDEYRYPRDGRFVVSRTRDGGATFEVIAAGLPQVPSYDLVYRHGLDVDATGSRLAMGSTTGGAWVSEDGGDSWRELPARLPPVYAVRFI